MAGTVTVGCRLPNGLVLQRFHMVEHDEPVMAGGFKTVKKASPLGNPVKINGAAKHHTREAKHEIRYGAGLTFGVDADFFAAWMAENKDLELVKNGLIFAQTKANDAEAQAKDHRKQSTGLEPLDPQNLPPEFRGRIETATAA